MKKRFFAFILSLCSLFSLCGCSQKSYQQDIFAMDTYMSLIVYGSKEALTESVQEINTLESLLSRHITNSEISQLNEKGSLQVSQDTLSLLQTCLAATQECNGVFDITIAPLVDAWDIHAESAHILTQKEVDALLPLVGSNHISIQGNEVQLDPGCSIDLGGVAKGYASNTIAGILEGYGVENAIISLGGNVYAKGINPQKKQPWRVAIQDPESDDYACVLSLSNKFAVTSGGYQRYYEDENGKRYIHILDPKTGMPVDNDLLSVTIISDNGTIADIYSTALFVMGSEKATLYYKNSDLFDMVLITKDHKVYYSGNLEEFLLEKSENYVYVPIT